MFSASLKFNVCVYDPDLLVDTARCLKQFASLDLTELAEHVPEGDAAAALRAIFINDQPLPGCLIVKRRLRLIGSATAKVLQAP